MAYTTPQLNIPEVSIGHLRNPYWLFKLMIGNRKPRRSEIVIAGAVFSYSCVHDDSEARCNMSYNQFAEKLHLSRATVARSVKSLRDKKIIEQDKSRRIGAAYRYIDPPQENGYIDTELYLYTTPFSVRGKREPVYLTKAQVDVLCLIKTHTGNKKGKGYFEGSVRSIARTVNLSDTTAQRAIDVLLRAGLIFRTENGRGVNLHKRSRYVANEKLLRVVRKKYKKDATPGNAPKKDNRTEAEIAADARADRERYYAELRQRDQARIDQHVGVLMKDEEYVKTDRAIRQLVVKIAAAEEHGLPGLNELRDQQSVLLAQRARRMVLCNIDEKDVQPMYKCRRCSDTGFTPDGRMCDCYPPGRDRR